MTPLSGDPALQAVVEAARSWAAGNLADRRLPAQVDIDELMASDPPPKAVAAAVACGDVAFREALAMGSSVNVIVAIPLEYSEVLSMVAPRLGELIDQSWPYGPGVQVPGIYLVDPEILATYEATEEYRLALDDEAIPRGAVAYYRCWRELSEGALTLEYDRAIYFRWISHPGITSQR